MGQAVARKLIFYLGEVGFILDLIQVVEVCERTGERLDTSRNDPGQGIVGAFHFRKTWVPAVDPSLQLALHPTQPLAQKTALILKSPEGNWALLVDRVEGMMPSTRFEDCALPPLLRTLVRGCYSQIKLLGGVPLIVFEAEHFYGGLREAG